MPKRLQATNRTKLQVLKITERHYAPWVKARQEQLEADLVRAWRSDPIVQAAILGGDMTHQDQQVQNGTATETTASGVAKMRLLILNVFW